MKKICLWVSVVMMVFGLALLCGNQPSVQAESGKYVLDGNTIWQGKTLLFFDSTGSQEGCPDQFTISMYADQFDRESEELSNNSCLNWEHYIIDIQAHQITHNLFQIVRDGNVILSKSLSGGQDLTLFSGELPEGNYTIQYVGSQSSLFLYSFRIYKFTYSFTVDRTVPAVGLYTGGEEWLPSESFTSQQTEFRAADSNFSKLYYKGPGQTSFKGTEQLRYLVPAKAENNGTWEFYAEDRAGNQTEVFRFVLDTEKPQLYAKCEDERVSGKYVDRPFRFEAEDSGQVAREMILRPGEEVWEEYTGEELREEGTYLFQVRDRAGNTSKILEICYDTVPPELISLAAGEELEGEYTNAEYIQFTAKDLYAGLSRIYVRKDGGEAWEYTGIPLFEEGTYTFYAVDLAGNQSAEQRVVLCRSIVPPKLDHVQNSVTAGNFSVTWEEGTVPIAAATINGRPYQNGTEIQTVCEGVYEIELRDAAGNIWRQTIRSVRENVLTKTCNQQWWETSDAAGDVYSFDSYEKAVGFALQRELDSAVLDVWQASESWDKGIIMDAKDSLNAAPGKFYVYKSEQDPALTVAYFTDTRLNEVAYQYAKASVEAFYYWQKQPAQAFTDSQIYALAENRTVIAGEIELTGDVWLCTGSRREKVEIFRQPGTHDVKLEDDWGNSYAYRFIVLDQPPVIYYQVKGGQLNQPLQAEIYLKEPIYLSVRDELDASAMLLVRDPQNQLHILSGQKYFSGEQEGTYVVQSVNRAGFSDPVYFHLSLHPAEIFFREDKTNRQLIIEVVRDVELTNLRILKSEDGGNTWKGLAEDDTGQAITHESSVYCFASSGLYRVLAEDAFRNGFEAVVKEYEYLQPVPDWVLIGVNEYGYANDCVWLETDEIVFYELIKDGQVVAYDGSEITEEGEYLLTVRNRNQDRESFRFVVDKTPPQAQVFGRDDDNGTGVWLVWTEPDLRAELYRNGELIGAYRSGQVLTDQGYYEIRILDLAGNETVETFTLGNSAGITSAVWNGGVSNEDVSVSIAEGVVYRILRDGELLSDAELFFSEDGNYEIQMLSGEDYITAYRFEIVKRARRDYAFIGTGDLRIVSVTKDGKVQELLSGQSYRAQQSGLYEFTLTDGLHTQAFRVVIDQAPPSLDMNVEDGGRTSSGVKISGLSEAADMTVYRNNQPIEYQLGQTLTDPGYYRVVLEDEAGNVAEYSFEIYFAYNAGSILLFVMALGVGIGILVYIVRLRKRKN